MNNNGLKLLDTGKIRKHKKIVNNIIERKDKDKKRSKVLVFILKAFIAFDVLIVIYMMAGG